jgi:cytochrome c oxidase assembly protein subunit 15
MNFDHSNQKSPSPKPQFDRAPQDPEPQPTQLFCRATLFLIFYTVAVIIWGAWVRISHSGDGCGNHWPLCEGALFPQTADSKTWVEYTHRLTSGLYGVGVALLYLWSFRRFSPGSIGRRVALSTFILMIVEALLGAALVLKGLVGENATLFRLVVMTFHQINSLLLVGSTVILNFVAKPLNEAEAQHLRASQLTNSLRKFLLFFLIPATGSWAALANTLFPSQSLQEGILKDLQGDGPWIFRLRIFHPILAIGIGWVLVISFIRISERSKDSRLSKAALELSGAFFVALAFGFLTLLFLSPIWMKLVHLSLALGLWILLVRYAMISLLSTSR